VEKSAFICVNLWIDIRFLVHGFWSLFLGALPRAPAFMPPCFDTIFFLVLFSSAGLRDLSGKKLSVVFFYREAALSLSPAGSRHYYEALGNMTPGVIYLRWKHKFLERRHKLRRDAGNLGNDADREVSRMV